MYIKISSNLSPSITVQIVKQYWIISKSIIASETLSKLAIRYMKISLNTTQSIEDVSFVQFLYVYAKLTY